MSNSDSTQKNKRCRLSDDKKKAFFADVNLKTLTQKQLSEKYGIHQSTVSNLIKRKDMPNEKHSSKFHNL